MEIFQAAGWLQYFERLQGHGDYVALDFARNLEGNHSEVRGVPIEVSEQAIAEVTRIQQRGTRWFGKRKRVMQIKELFARGDEFLQHKGHGIARASLLPPWDTVALTIQKFLT